MVFVKVRETYDLHTVRNKMTVISVHTPKPTIIARNYPGLLLQCRAYRPVSADVRVACASMMPLDPQGVGTAEGDVAPEDVFNPILYKAMSNKGMSQLEARINYLNSTGSGADVSGDTSRIDVDSFTSYADEFNIYYGLLANTHDWKHANPQAGLSMSDLRPLVYERLYNVGDDPGASAGIGADVSGNSGMYNYPSADGSEHGQVTKAGITGAAKPLPFMNCLAYTTTGQNNPLKPSAEGDTLQLPSVHAQSVPWVNCVVAALVIPPSRLHELFFRMVVEWTIEFSQVRPLSEVTSWVGLGLAGEQSHFQNYDYSATKEALTGDSSTILDKDTTMVSSNVDVNKVM